MLSEFTNMRSDGSGSLEDEYRELVDEILKERFPDGFSFTKIIVEPSTNLDGEDYIHTYIVFEGELKNLDPGKTLGISTRLWPDARKMGYAGIPIQSFVKKSEWTAVNG
jgi:hypothetical protein